MIAAAFLAAALARAAAPSGPAAEGSPMGNAVITVPSKVPFRGEGMALGKGGGLAWGRHPWKDTGSIPPQSALAYLDEDAFRAATAGLKGRNVAAVLAKRAGAQDQVIPDLAGETALELAALAAIRAADRPGSLPPEYPLFLSGFGIGRSFGGTLEDIVRALELRGTLDTLEREWIRLEKAPLDPQFRPDSLSALTRAACARAAANLGQDAFLKAPFRARPLRIAFLAKPGPFLDPIRRHEIPAEKWEGGWLAALDPGQLRQAEQMARAIVIFPSYAAYSRSLNLETTAQRKLRIGSLLAQGGPGPSGYREAVFRTRAELLAVLEGILASAPGLPPIARTALESARAGELAALAPAAPPFPSADSGSAPSAAPGNSLSARLGLLAAFAVRSGQPQIADWSRTAARSLGGVP